MRKATSDLAPSLRPFFPLAAPDIARLNDGAGFNALSDNSTCGANCSAGLVFLCLSLSFLALVVSGQSGFGQATATTVLGQDPCAVGQKQGVVVETVAKNSEAAKAGLMEGDIISGWARGNVRGEISLPFDLTTVEIEQAPRGEITLTGTEATASRAWVLGQDKWGLGTNPNLLPPLQSAYREADDLAKAGKLAEAVARWRAIAAEAQKHQCPLLSVWFLLHASGALSNGQRWKEADQDLQEAIRRAPTSRPEITARLLEAQADSFFQREDLDHAGEYYRRALDAWGILLPESLEVAASARGLGAVAIKQSNLDEAEKYYRQAFEIRTKLAPGSLAVADSLNTLGNLALARSDFDQADQYYRDALAIREKLAPNSLVVEATVNNLGIIAEERGDLDKAEEYFQQGLTIDQRLVPDSEDVATDFNNLSVVAKDRGYLYKADAYLRQSLKIEEKLAPGGLIVAFIFDNLGVAAEYRGDLVQAEDYHKRALAIRQRLAPGSLAVAASLTNLGAVAQERGDSSKAEEEYFRQALAIRQKVAPGSLDVADSLDSFGDLAYASGDLAKAEEYYQQALSIRKKLAPGSTVVADSLSGLGNIERLRNNLAEAEAYYDQALAIRKKQAPETTDYADTLAALGRIKQKRGQPDAASQLFQQAADVLESQTNHLGGSAEVRSSFRAAHAEYHADYIDLLVEQKRPEAAFRVLERSRARTLLETLAAGHVDVRQGVDHSLLERERSVQASIRKKTNFRIDLLETNPTPAQLAALTRQIDELLRQYAEVESEIRASSPRYTALTQPQPLTAKEVQATLLDADTLLLEYILGKERSYVFALTPTTLDVYELPRRSEIESTALRLYSLLTSQGVAIGGESAHQLQARSAEASKLSRMVMGPLTAQLGNKRLLIVSDGVLQYIPFAVLPIPDSKTGGNVATFRKPTSLVAEHEIINLPSASVLAVLRDQQARRRSSPPRAVAVLADAVFNKNDSRVLAAEKQVTSAKPAAEVPAPVLEDKLTRSIGDISAGGHSSLPRLVFSRREATVIMSLTPPGEGLQALDFQASRETAISPELAQYRIVHFATHGLLDSKRPELSGLVFSLVNQRGKPQNGFLDLQDIYNLNLSADLVVLSSCETGLGKEIDGEGLVGLTQGFMYAGAERVIASLWKVDDAATAVLMEDFYRAMLKEGLTPAAALRQAQLDMSKKKQWAAPYYWGAFTLQGEWK